MSETVDPVVVGVDGTDTAIRAARWAAAVADKYAASLHIVYANPVLAHLSAAVSGALPSAELAELRRSCEPVLQEAEHAVRADFTALPVTTTRVSNSVRAPLTDVSRHARLVVLGSDDVLPGPALLVGSTTLRQAPHSPCPVVAWHGDLIAPTQQGIVLGVDDAHNSGAAIAAAFEFAERIGVGITAIRAWSAQRRAGDVSIPLLVDWDKAENDYRLQLGDALSPWSKLYPDVEVTCVVDKNKPIRALLNHIGDAQLVVVGSRGRGFLASVVAGSTSLKLLHQSAVPVMVCRRSDDK
jgi:nucleotide-binding universal stress UspA family protein